MFVEHEEIVILDTIMIEDTPPQKLAGYELSSGSVHEVVVL